MRPVRQPLSAAASLALLALSSVAGAQVWNCLAQNAQHTAESGVPSQYPQVIAWSTPVDLDPWYSGGDLYIHYGSALVTSANTIIVPVKTGWAGGFQVEAHSGATGALLWSQPTDYVLPAHNWIPSYGPALTSNGRVYYAGAGGTVYYRANLDWAGAVTPTQLAFYGLSNYQANPAAFNASIQICTPITSDGHGDIYFGFVSSGAALPGFPNGLPSGLARIGANGQGSFVSAAAASGNASISRIVTNCAPAVTANGATVYVTAVASPTPNDFNSWGYLCALDASTLTRRASVELMDPRSGVGIASLPDDGSASPTIGPDGDVYIGVLEGDFPSNNDRGWLLHYSGDLATTKIPGAFGWDDTASVVPSSAVPSYTGPSSYLLLTKYNNYIGVGSGNGENKLAILDPNGTEIDPITGATVMKEVITVLGPTPSSEGGVCEWCINSAAIDAANKCAAVNSEDGHLYRWDFTTNTLSPPFPMAAATGEAYTSTVIGADGTMYATNNAALYAIRAAAFPTVADVTYRVAVTRSVFAYDRATGTYDQTVTVKNMSGSAITGPVSVALTGLANGTLSNASGVTVSFQPAGRPYINVTGGNLAAGASASVTLRFHKSSSGAITYGTQVLAGPGSR